MNKTIVIFHSRDIDGFMSAAIVKHWFEINKKEDDIIDFIGYDYGDPTPNLLNFDKIILCDVAFSKEEMTSLYNDYLDNFIWIDHHASTMKDNEDLLIYGLRDVKFSACELTWLYFFPQFSSKSPFEGMPEIVRLLGRYDCFQYKKTDEELKVLEFQYGARQKITNYLDAYKTLTETLTTPYESEGIVIDTIHEKGKIIYQYLCAESKQIYSRAHPIQLFEEEYWPDGKSKGIRNLKPFLCVNQERFNPINFGIDYHKDGYCGFLSFYYDKGQWVFSIYNDDGNTDVSTIAKDFGGGGHKLASGFIIDKINKFLKKTKIDENEFKSRRT